MSNKKNSARKIVPQSVVTVETEEQTPAVEATTAPRKLTREEWKLLSPEEKKAARAAKRANRPSPAPRLGKNMARLVKRLARVVSMIDASKDGSEEQAAAECLGNARNLLDAAAGHFENFPANWKPVARAARGETTSKFEAGQFVQIAEKRRASFEGLLEADEMLELRVVKVVGKKLVLATEGGVRMVLPQNVIAAKG